MIRQMYLMGCRLTTGIYIVGWPIVVALALVACSPSGEIAQIPPAGPGEDNEGMAKVEQGGTSTPLPVVDEPASLPAITNTPLSISTPVSTADTPTPQSQGTTESTPEAAVNEQPNAGSDLASETGQPANSTTAEIESGAPTSSTEAIIVDHHALDQFDRIPDDYIKAASELRLLFRHASVGANIGDGLNCLMNNFSGKRPHQCDRDLPAGQVIFDQKYDRTNWTFEFHSPPPSANPGWWNKVNFFIDRINNLSPTESYDVISFKVGYVDGIPGSNIDDKFFNNNPTDNLPSVEDLETLTAAHPDKTMIWWTMGLARVVGTEDAASFNRQMRDYALAHNKVLLDIADIESHTPDGTACTDSAGAGIEAICQEYTAEAVGGHLNALGAQRMAKAVWVLMARLAGWKG